ncbi:MAG: sigma factor, partial [Bacteroidota bacterium]
MLSPEEFKSLFHQHYRFLFSVALQLGADRELAKDLIQALFLRLWEKRSAQPAVEHWPAYLKKSLTRDTLRALQA